MNTRTIFANASKTIRDDDVAELVKKEYRKLRNVIFSVTPEACFLKMWHVLDLSMVFMLSPKMIKKGLVNPKDICALCSANDCPFNKVSYKNLRIIKIKLLGKIFNQ